MNKIELELDYIENVKYNIYCIKNDQYISSCVKRKLEWDGWMRIILEKIYKPGTDIIDIGSNIGTNTLMFSDYGPVHSFEPVFHTIVEKNVNANKLKHGVTVYPIALSNTCREVDFYICKSTDETENINYGGTTMYPHDCSDMNKKVKCLTNTLDNVYKGVPSIIKIDVEGAEMDVLNGSINTIKKHKPFIMIEIHDYKNSEIPKLLKSMSYQNPELLPEYMYLFKPFY
jgi:FkbM family methyltransferase